MTADELDDLGTQSKKLISSFTAQLNAEYESAYALNDNDAVANVCRTVAKKTADGLSRGNWSVRRISLRYLNENNAPDYAEKKILEDFTTKYANGWNTDQLAWYQLSEVGNQSEFRYVKATAYDERCLSCHSSQREGQPGLYAFALKKIETKNYIEEPVIQKEATPLPAFEE